MPKNEVLLRDDANLKHPRTDSTTPYTLEDYLGPNPVVERFMDDDDFWNDLQVTAQIPLDYLVESDPTVLVVGKKEEIRAMKITNYNAVLHQEKRVQRFNDIRLLFLEIDYLKKHGHRKAVSKLDQELREKQNTTDDEQRLKKIISSFEASGYDRRKALRYIFDNFERVILEAEINYESIAEIMSREFSTPEIVTFIGPMGSGKSHLQEIGMRSYLDLLRHLDVRGFEYIVVRDPADRDKPKLVKLVEGESQRIINYYDSKQENKRKLKKAALYAGLAIAAYPLAHLFMNASLYELESTTRFSSTDLIKKVGGILLGNFEKIALGLIAGGVLGHYVLSRNKERKKRDNRPVLASNSDIQIHGGPISNQEFVGEYRKDRERPVQEYIIAGSILRGDGKGIIIEQLSLTKEDDQATLAEIIQEGKIPIANGETFTDYRAMWYVGQNQFLIQNIIKPLLDRLNLGETCYVTNDVERNNRTKKQFYIFLEYYRRLTSAPSFGREAVERALEISSILAEDVDRLEISRRFLKIIDGSLNLAREAGKNYVTLDNINAASKETMSPVEQELSHRVRKYYNELGQPREEHEVGSVNVVSYVTDTHLVKADTDNPTHQKELAELNGLGYIVNIRANANESRDVGSAGLHLTTPEEWTDERKREYSSIIKKLLKIKGYDLANHSLDVDLSSALAEDDVLISGSYAASVSAIEGIPINQHAAILAAYDGTGNSLRHPSKMNKRIFTLSGIDQAPRIDTILVPERTIDRIINPNYLSQYNIREIKDLGNIEVLNGVRKAA